MTPNSSGLHQLEDRLRKACRLEKDQVVLRALFTDLVRMHYSDQFNLCSKDIPLLRKYIWNEDDLVSKMYIDVTGKFDPSIVEKRPAIFVDIDDFEYVKVARNDQIGEDLREGAKLCNLEVHTAAMFYHVGTTPDEALMLARQTTNLFLGFSEMLRTEYRFAKVQVRKSTKAAVLQEAKERWVSTVSVELVFNEAWQILVESHKLKKIDFTITPS